MEKQEQFLGEIWHRYYSSDSKKFYYYNEITTWNAPDSLSTIIDHTATVTATVATKKNQRKAPFPWNYHEKVLLFKEVAAIGFNNIKNKGIFWNLVIDKMKKDCAVLKEKRNRKIFSSSEKRFTQRFAPQTVLAQEY